MKTFRLEDTGAEYVRTSLLPSEDGWVNTPTAANVVNISAKTWPSYVSPLNEYMGLDRRVRGTNGKTSARGQGWQWYAPELERVRQLRQLVGGSLKVALIVNRAFKRGDLDFMLEDLRGN